MIVKIIRIFLVLLGVMSLALTMPGLYRTLFAERAEKKWIYFSEINKDFVITEEVPDEVTGTNRMIYYDTEGERFTEHEYMKLLPFLNTRKLALLEELPDSINGVAFDHDLQQTVKRGMLVPDFSFSYRINPLFESQSGEVRPTLPDDLFRINKRGVEFIDPQTNRIIPQKSKIFTEALLATGFQLPAQAIYGIPSVLKARDDGYFVVDRAGGLYHIIMVKGAPICHRIETPVEIRYMKCVVPGDIYAYIYDRDMQLYVLQLDYTVKKLPFPPSNGRYMYSHNLFYKTFKNTDRDKVHMYVLDGGHNLVAQYSMETDHYSKSRQAVTETYIFPFTILITPDYSHMIPLPNPAPRFIWLNLVLLAVFVSIKAVKHRRLLSAFTFIDALCVAAFGLFGFISILIFPNRK